MRILLACAVGCTTSMLVKKMYESAEPEDHIEAHSINDVFKLYKDYDCVILGPQVRIQFPKIKEMCEKDGIPVDIVDVVAYGRMDGKKVLDQARKLIGNKK